MTAATFGDFVRQAGEHLDAALASSQDELADPAAAAGQLRRIAATMIRYLDDRTLVDVVEASRRTDLDPWERAAIDTRAALHQAASCLTPDSGTASRTGREPARKPARSLAAAATCLAAGRDLLHTHLATSEEMHEYRSDWGPALTSLPVTRALTDWIARWSRQLAPLAASLASAHTTGTPRSAAAREALQAASRWLGAVGAATRPAQAADPVTTDDVRLLQAILARQPPQRRPPAGAEPVAALCAGIMISAQRLRAAVSATAGQPPWTPTLTADTWRWTARAIAVTGHASELALRALAGHPGQPRSQLDGPQMQAAADATAEAWAAWRQVSAAWTGLSTETRGQASPVVPEISDLVLRTGRLAWNDPHWTPARSTAATSRDLGGLLSSDVGIAAVIGALHQAADASACVAAADLKAVGTADRTGRLYVTTRSLPDSYDIPRPYAPAPAGRNAPLLHAYQAAVKASTQAAEALAALALASNAPSSTLALARAAATRRHGSSSEEGKRPDTSAPGGRPKTGTAARGPVERAVRSLRVTDPILLLRAAAIDHASRQLLARAEQVARSSDGQSGGTQSPRGPGRAARLAAQDTPSVYAAASEEGSRTQAPSSRPGLRPAPRAVRIPRP